MHALKSLYNNNNIVKQDSAYLQVAVENPTEYTAVWIIRNRFKYPAAGFVLASTNQIVMC